MVFFTAGDVLSYSIPDTDNPVTIQSDDSIQKALTVMLSHDFDQLPVVKNDGIAGVITYKSIAKCINSVDESYVTDSSISMALIRDVNFVERDRDVFNLLETFAEDDFVLIGNSTELVGILTRYDILYFMEYQIEPLLKIGEIEETLRELFDSCCENLDSRISNTFIDRAENDDSYEIPESLDRFSFDEYRMFMTKNLEVLPEQIREDRDMIEPLLEDIRDTRNAVFHFRDNADKVDRDQLDIAHNYFTGIIKDV